MYKNNQLRNIIKKSYFSVERKNMEEKGERGEKEILSCLSHQEIIIILKWLSTIEKNEKLDINKLTIYSNNLPNRIYRTIINNIPFNGISESRHSTLEFITYIIDESINMLDEVYNSYLKDNSNKKQLENIINIINNCCLGIENLKYTYLNDRMFVCVIDTLLEQKIKLILYKIKEKSPEFFTENGDGVKGKDVELEEL
jgi:hypothetical protein